MRTFRLSPEAQTQHDRLSALLAELGLSPDQAHALLLAPLVCDDLAEREDATIPEDVLDAWGEDGHEAWHDVLREIPAFVTEA